MWAAGVAGAAARIVFLDSGSFTQPLKRRDLKIPHDWRDYETSREDQVTARLQGAQVAITNALALDANQLEGLDELRLIAACSTGLDHIDLEFCRAQGIVVVNATDYAAHTVAEHGFCLLLALRRNLESYLHDQRNGLWQKSGRYSLPIYPIADLVGSRFGIVGRGAIGETMAEIARGFGMEVSFAARKGVAPTQGRLDFEEVLASSDVISLNLPLLRETERLIGAAEFALMARKPILINCARGGLIEEEALVQALEKGQIAGYGADVATQEPPDPESPLCQIMDDPRVLVTPHVAWASTQAQQALFDQILDKVEAFLLMEDSPEYSAKL
jgi:glycerate dehydrogenase